MILPDTKATLAAGRAIGDALRPGDIVALSGPLGAGKTVMAKGILAALGFAGDVPSPTFAIVIPYDVPDTRFAVHHIDLYRLEDMAEIEELGLDDALSHSALIVEWPERLGDRLWPDALCIAIAIEATGRRLTVDAPASWKARWPFR